MSGNSASGSKPPTSNTIRQPWSGTTQAQNSPASAAPSGAPHDTAVTTSARMRGGEYSALSA